MRCFPAPRCMRQSERRHDQHQRQILRTQIRETVRLIKTGALLELIFEAAKAGVLHDLLAVLLEAEQGKFLSNRKVRRT